MKLTIEKFMADYILLIWQGVPETLDLYLIPSSEIDNEDLDIFYFNKCDQKLQGNLNSCDEDDALNFVSIWLSEKGKPFKINQDKLFILNENQHIEKVIVSGFIL